VEFITLGIGTPASIASWLLVGLSTNANIAALPLVHRTTVQADGVRYSVTGPRYTVEQD